MSARNRVIMLVAVLLAALAGAGGYVWNVRKSQAETLAAAPEVAQGGDLQSLRAQPHIVFRSNALGENYGRVAVVPLTAPNGPRAFTPASCERVYATAADTICLSAQRGLVTTYQSRLLDPSWNESRELPLTGLPSRARLSRDGSLVATTTFVYGDSYANPGQFSTRTLVTRTDGAVVGDIEKFKLVVDGRVITAADRNLWGVTFADDDRFFVTAASGGKTWLAEGNLSTRTVTSIRGDVECPSLSPDGTRIAFKKHGDLPAGKWRLAVYNLRTGTEIELAETRSIDDQAEWLDDATVLYGLSHTADGSASSDVWKVPADGSGKPEVLISDAWSPAVVR
ncbi:TolB-like translocation protein; signal peptide [Actinoplanes philippinensis]|uniref:WD40-like Beta Propeller Repeat n=1 Tax=Actinoplanes philippinensis TaxID=35752 RepID=A0A1I2A8K9_9ACTN|nr:PD40 domain-containing protein [Actinoplanes philippinensis]GIE75016.1 TolB-like translocation protein; signal peptide [Actinoplanes philippinensis]SFE40291.1 WD40-like Beta Propeller Repeat [Actinoplanes philippinensis]